MHVKTNHSANDNGNSNIIIIINNINNNNGMPWLAPFLTSPPKEESFKINIICLPGLLEKGTRDSKFCCRRAGSLLQAGGICPMAGCESHLAQADGSQKT